MKRALLGGTVAAALLATGSVAVSSAAAQSTDDGPNVVDLVVELSGASGLDTNGRDYDLLREALVATELADVVAAERDITVFAPNDWAFINLARDLGYHDWDEAGALAFLIEATNFQSAELPGLLDDVLLYHVSPGAERRFGLNMMGPVETYVLDTTLEVVDGDVIDQDPNNRDARIILPFNAEVSNGIVHTVDRVLLPLDLEPAPSDKPGIVGTVIELSGATGLDDNGRDYDLLREALLATGLADVVAAAEGITVFAPNDWAFINLARDLGYTAWDEAGALEFLIAATGFESADAPGILDQVLLYHVLGEELRRWPLNEAGPVATLQGATLEVVNIGDVIDQNPGQRDARIILPFNVEVANGTIHTVDQVLLPIDLTPATG